MLSEWDMSGLMFRRGRCTSIVDLFICNTRNEDADHVTRSRHRNLQLETVEAFKGSVLLRDSGEPTHKAWITTSEIYTNKNPELSHTRVYLFNSQRQTKSGRKDHRSHKPGTKSKMDIPPTLPPAPPRQPTPHPNPQAPSTQRRTRQCQRGRVNSPVQLLRGIPSHVRVFFEGKQEKKSVKHVINVQR